MKFYTLYKFYVDAIILSDGLYPKSGNALKLLNSGKKVVCCDGAADKFIENGGMPFAIVGDCDSVSVETKKKYSDIVFCSEEQDTNDLSKAIKFCTERNFKKLVILGATGKREDHAIGNISILAKNCIHLDIVMITDYGIFNAIDEDSEFESFYGQQVSLFTLNPGTKICAENLYYKIPSKGLESWWCGTLNKCISDRFTIKTNDKCIVYRVF